MELKEYQVMGCSLPTKEKSSPPIYRMRIFAVNELVAKSRFWNLLNRLHKIKKSNGEIISVNEIFEKRPLSSKIYGIWLRYNSRSGTHNMYKEYIDVSRAGAVSLCYKDMAARHRVSFSSIQIIRVAQIKASEVRRPYTKQVIAKGVNFPNLNRVYKPADKSYTKTFLAKRPNLS